MKYDEYPTLPNSYHYPVSTPKPIWLRNDALSSYWREDRRRQGGFRLSKIFAALELLNVIRHHEKLPQRDHDYGVMVETTGTVGPGAMFPVNWDRVGQYRDFMLKKFIRSPETATLGPFEVPTVEVAGVTHLMVLDAELSFVQQNCFKVVTPNISGLLHNLRSDRHTSFESSELHHHVLRHFVGRVIWVYALEARVMTWDYTYRAEEMVEAHGEVSINPYHIYTDNETDVVLLKMIERGEYKHED